MCKLGAVSFIRYAVLRRIGFFASRCSFFPFSTPGFVEKTLRGEFQTPRAVKRNSCRQIASFCAGADSNAVLVQIWPEIFLRTSVLFLGRLAAFFRVLLYRFPHRGPSIENSALSCSRFSKNSSTQKINLSRDLTPCCWC